MAVVSPMLFHDSKCNAYKYSFVSDCAIAKKKKEDKEVMPNTILYVLKIEPFQIHMNMRHLYWKI